jgi:transcriptional regulator GlxA family with amidase domain
MYKVKIFIFDGVELLDFAGPLEVFSVAAHLTANEPVLDIETIAFKNEITVSKSGIKVTPNSTDINGPYDLLIIPGGFGTRSIINDSSVLDNVRQLISQASCCASVCTGALILGKLGFLDGLSVTTHAIGVPLLKEVSPACHIDRSKRYIDNECILTSAGISAGIDMSLYIIEKRFGRKLRQKVQEYMEYCPS